MDTNMNQQPKIMKESKNKIKVDFERTPLKERMKAKFLNMFFYQKVVWYIFRLVLLIGVCYVVISPFISMIAGSFMVPDDLVDPTVLLISRAPTLDIYKAVFTELPYWEAMWNTFTLSLACAVLQTFVCCLVGYGLAKFRFRGNKFVFLMVILTMIIPHQTIQGAMRMFFQEFDIWGIVSFLSGGMSIGVESVDATLAGISLLDMPKGFANLYNTSWPLMILSVTGLGFKNGLYVFMLRQFFTGVPDALEESAYIDGSGVFRTFFTIILPLSIPMLVTVFLFAFCWQWTDNFYTQLFFFDESSHVLMPQLMSQIPNSLKATDHAAWLNYQGLIQGTTALCVIAPLIILYAFCQNFLVQGIERSGLTAD